MQLKKRALGRGLDALLPTRPEANKPTKAAPSTQTTEPEAPTSRNRTLAVDTIRPNPNQPRVHFDDDSLRELAESIRQKGLLQPVAVMPDGDSFLLVAGERRWRAATLAGLLEVPAIILDPLSPQELLECALVENLQRENLSDLEEARAYKALIDTFDLSQEEIATRVGKSRPTIANALRLLKLPIELQKDLEEERITAGHARSLLSLDTLELQRQLRDAIIAENLSVRQAEDHALRLQNRIASTRERAPKSRVIVESLDIRQLRDQLVDSLSCKVVVKPKDVTSGRIEIYYESLDELDRILTRIQIET